MVICHMVRFNIIFYLQYSDISEHHIPVTSPVPTQSGMHFFQYPPSLDQTRTALFLVPTQSGLDSYCTFSSTDVAQTRLVLHFFQYRRSLDQTGTALCVVPVQSGHPWDIHSVQYRSSRDIHRNQKIRSIFLVGTFTGTALSVVPVDVQLDWNQNT